MYLDELGELEQREVIGHRLGDKLHTFAHQLLHLSRCDVCVCVHACVRACVRMIRDSIMKTRDDRRGWGDVLTNGCKMRVSGVVK